MSLPESPREGDLKRRRGSSPPEAPPNRKRRLSSSQHNVGPHVVDELSPSGYAQGTPAEVQGPLPSSIGEEMGSLTTLPVHSPGISQAQGAGMINKTPITLGISSSSSSFFPGAHSFGITNSTFINSTYTLPNATVIDRNPDNENAALDRLSQRTIPGAEYDSSERDPPPLCHPSTRLEIRGEVQRWLRNQHRLEKVLWLHGPAGAGKSAVIQSLAEDESDSPDSILGATFFFSRTKGFVDAQFLFTTIAHQLGIKYPSYRHYIVNLLTRDRRIPNKKMAIQFQHFIREPFGNMALEGFPDTVAIFIDGLDECMGTGTQKEIVLLIGNFVLEFPTSRIIWAIASRPEAPLKESFQSLANESASPYKQIILHVNSEEGCRDVERFLRDSFQDVRKQYPSSFPPSRPWPTETHFLEIASAASGHFGFATTVMKFIIDEDRGNPAAQLATVIQVINLVTLPSNKPQPLAMLDAMYTQILSTVPTDILPTTMALLSIMTHSYEVYHLSGELVPFTLEAISLVPWEWLGLSQEDVDSALRKLCSVLSWNVFPPPGEKIKPPEPHHASFTDFLMSPERSGRFHVRDPTPDLVTGAVQFVLQAHHPPSNSVDPLRITRSLPPHLTFNMSTNRTESETHLSFFFKITLRTILRHLSQLKSEENTSSDICERLSTFFKDMDYTGRSPAQGSAGEMFDAIYGRVPDAVSLFSYNSSS
ncbi:hypothetical protein NP233_g5088 [Leucocoprinus birnbaumii]|uniref:NACHT domain-containing protein n=1 Tax=Leucocoprinus birnbaumii TaxID=56174 RepID=A0AAD5VTJ8_9AGAR|nr:hypothetical protein NP233_g5088 [Leucocoprinus birnbaumii]